MLIAQRQRRAQAKDGVRGDAACRQDGGDQCETVRGAGDVAIREPRPRVPVGSQQSTRIGGGDRWLTRSSAT